MNRPIRYGILGFGRFADKTIAPAIKQASNSQLVAIHNRSLAKAQELAATHAVDLAFESAEDLVAHPDVDAVFIVSANTAHCSETILAAQAGKHVLCEKPMAMTVAECELMIEACKKHGVQLMVGHMLRLSPLVARIKELVQSGVLGRIIHAEANFIYDARLSSRSWLIDTAVAGGGPTFDVGIHCFDTLRHIFDDEVVSVKGELMPPPTAQHTDTSAHLLLRFAKGTIASVFTSYDAPIRESYIEIIGTEARVSATDFTVGNRRGQLVIENRNGSLPGNILTEEIDVPNLYAQEVTHFSECIRSNCEPVLSGENGLANQRILDAVLRLPPGVIIS